MVSVFFKVSLGRTTSSTEEPIITNRGRSLTFLSEKHPPFVRFQGLCQ
jgi:hypothetical protein